MKVCMVCGKEHDYRVLNYCKSCYARKYRQANLDKVHTQKSASYLRCKEHVNNHSRENYLKDPLKIKQCVLRYKTNNRDKYLQTKRNGYYNKLKENPNYNHETYLRSIPQRKLYLKQNNDELREYRRLYRIKKKKEDLNFRIRVNLANRILIALKRGQKYEHTIDLIGCSIPELKKHLELQFKAGMSWNNYGRWHIDHRVACARFDLTKRENQLKCFHYSNLQPLWDYENFSKGAR